MQDFFIQPWVRTWKTTEYSRAAIIKPLKGWAKIVIHSNVLSMSVVLKNMTKSCKLLHVGVGKIAAVVFFCFVFFHLGNIALFF